eukprot:gnl/MRDRNA2_/MRDRNA2_42892_c0_seq1.p1 gnl/MRDRNA2_/MRDRNA2_42892_c0~~gnl/MRDRNA2_/MRDRNA2_42892_c0_seq1.p1  ORF type:complete len:109 (-),score=2.87 gnl/MRDRNA2_/MRDRNA2_42892_c0_seq1:10-336(-)
MSIKHCHGSTAIVLVSFFGRSSRWYLSWADRHSPNGIFTIGVVCCLPALFRDDTPWDAIGWESDPCDIVMCKPRGLQRPVLTYNCMGCFCQVVWTHKVDECYIQWGRY